MIGGGRFFGAVRTVLAAESPAVFDDLVDGLFCVLLDVFSSPSTSFKAASTSNLSQARKSCPGMRALFCAPDWLDADSDDGVADGVEVTCILASRMLRMGGRFEGESGWGSSFTSAISSCHVASELMIVFASSLSRSCMRSAGLSTRRWMLVGFSEARRFSAKLLNDVW